MTTAELLASLDRAQIVALYIAYLTERHEASRDDRERELIRRVLGNVAKIA